MDSDAALPWGQPCRMKLSAVRYMTELSHWTSSIGHFMNALHTCLALGPLAAYFMALGLVNLSRRPLLATGSRDYYALAVAVSGLIAVGPLEFFMPDRAATYFTGVGAWSLVLLFYLLCVTLLILMARPRLVIYNMTLEQLRPLLGQMIARLNLEQHWAGESLALPQWHVELQLERLPALRNVSLVATAADQSFRGWQKLEQELAAELRSVEVKPNGAGAVMLVASLGLLAASVIWLIYDRQAVAQGLLELLRM